MEIKIYTTGGSIDKYYSTEVSDFVVGEPQIADILQDANLGIEYKIESLFKKDSLKITDTDRDTVFTRVKSDPHKRIVVTHGTDTIIQTAKLLSTIEDKVIVLTGAMQPAAFKNTDAAFNFGAAVLAVQVLPVGVYVVMNGRIFDPFQSRKNMQLNQFEDI